jgi:uncharacterized repeat protein (TIGR01451 family)
VTFTFTVSNETSEPVTITSLSDTDYTLTGDGDCQVGTVLAGLGSCDFTQTELVDGDFAGPDHSNTFTATAEDDEGTEDSASATETVAFEDVAPTITVIKTAGSAPDGGTYEINEPGGSVTFTVTIENTSGSSDPVTVSSFSDSIDGGPASQPLGLSCKRADESTFVVATDTIASGETITCTFSRSVTGNPRTETNTVTVVAADNDAGGTDATDSDDAVVTIKNVSPTIQVTKTANPTSLPEPGGVITYTVTIKNTSVSSDPVTITSLTDSAYGDLDGEGTCDVPQTIQPGVTYTCTFSRAFVGVAGDSHSNTVTASGTDDENSAVSGSDDAAVLITVKSGSTMTNSAFQIVDDLGPWTITDFEALLNPKGQVIATNPGQFYYHQRGVNSYTTTTKWEFTLNWSSDFIAQTAGGQPIHAYIQMSDGSWIDWTSHASNICWSTKPGCVVASNIGTITVNDVPAGADVWVNVHLDYKLKGTTQNPSTFLKPPKVYNFSSVIAVKDQSTSAPMPGGTSSSSTTLLGRGKKVTTIYGTVTDGSGDPIPDTWVRVQQGTNYALTKTDMYGFYVVFDDQNCSADGLSACSGSWGTNDKITFANGTVATPIAILGNGATQSPTWTADAPTRPAGYTTGAISTSLSVAKGSAYLKNWKFS